MFTTKNYLWIALPGLLLAGLFGWLFIRNESVPLWLVGVVVVQVLLLAWWQRRDMRVVLQGGEGQQVGSGSSGWLFWLKRLVVLLLVLVLGGIGQSGWLVWRYDFPLGLAVKEPLWSLGVYPVPVPEMVRVPAGEFQMGSDKGEPNEKPVHPVTIASAFGMGKYEVTFDEYDYFVGEMRKAGIQLDNNPEAKKGIKVIYASIVEDLLKLINDPDAEKVTDTGTVGYPFPADEGWGRGQRPVINISWHGSQGYVNWLSKRTGRQCRLPSEAEWEYAARAMQAGQRTNTAYSWGDEIGENKANCNGCDSQWDGKETAPVGSFDANGFGLNDMHGNVWEWVQDCYQDSYQGAPVDGSAQEAQCDDDRLRVLRGGSWGYSPLALRSAFRFRYLPDLRDYDIGFRVVCSPP